MKSSFHVVVAGDGVAGALAAAVLRAKLPLDGYRVTMVPASATPDDTLGRVEPSLPHVRRFHSEQDIDEEELIRDAASFSLGAAYSGWSRAKPTYFHPFGDVGSPFNGVPFHHIAARLRTAGGQVSLADYSMAAMLAQTGRFARPSDDPRSPLSTYTYGLHLAVQSYTRQLLATAASRGVAFANLPAAGAEIAEDGSIAGLRLASGEFVEGDFFIDATGSAAQIIGALPAYRRESWQQWFAQDRIVEFLTHTVRAPAPYSHYAVTDGGWTRVVPGGGAVSELLTYSSAERTAEEAERTLHSALIGEPLGVAVHRQLDHGRAAAPWLQNCVAIGGAAAQIGGTAPIALHLVQSAVERLLPLFPRSRSCAVEAREYNRGQVLETDRCRDFALLPARLSGRLAEGPSELEDKIGLFRSRGEIELLDGDLFESQEWAAVFDGHAVLQERYSLLADAIPLDAIESQLGRMRQLMIAAVAGVPSHGHTLERIRRRAAA